MATIRRKTTNRISVRLLLGAVGESGSIAAA
jgi:hypothetical protein